MQTPMLTPWYTLHEVYYLSHILSDTLKITIIYTFTAPPPPPHTHTHTHAHTHTHTHTHTIHRLIGVKGSVGLLNLEYPNCTFTLRSLLTGTYSEHCDDNQCLGQYHPKSDMAPWCDNQVSEGPPRHKWTGIINRKEVSCYLFYFQLSKQIHKK